MHNLIWSDGKICEKEKVSIPIDSLGFLLGISVFDTVRVYKQAGSEKVHCFRLMDHINRLYKSLRIARINLEWNAQDIANAIQELILANRIKTDSYIRMTAYCASPSPGSSLFNPNAVKYGLLITIAESKIQETLKEIRCSISSWPRVSDSTMPPRIKAAANYQNARLAAYEAILDGYDNCIFLNDRGKVSEAAESALIMFMNNAIVTPDVNSDILESITRDTMLKIAKELLALEVKEKNVDRTEIYLADEIFLVNTAKLVRPVTEVDHYVIGSGNIGTITKSLFEAYMKVARRETIISEAWYSNTISV